MKIGFRQGLAVVVLGVLLLGSNGSWAACEAELEQAIKSLDATNPSASFKQNTLKDNLLTSEQSFLESVRGNYSFWREQNKTRDTGFAGYLVGEAEAQRRGAKYQRELASKALHPDSARNHIFNSDSYTFTACRLDFAAKTLGASGNNSNSQNQNSRLQNQAIQQAQQLAQQQAQSNADRARSAQQSGRLKDRSDLLCYDCDVGSGAEVQNGGNVGMNFVYCVVNGGGGANSCANGIFGAGTLQPGQKMQVVTPPSDYLVASCKAPGRPYNYSYKPSTGITIYCGEF